MSHKRDMWLSLKNEEENLKYIFQFDFDGHKLIKEFVVAEDFGEVFFNKNDQQLMLDSYPTSDFGLKIWRSSSTYSTVSIAASNS